MKTDQPNGPPAGNEEGPAKSVPRFSDLVLPLLYALGVTLVIFGLSEIVERLWLTHVDMSIIHLVHMVRDVFSSLVVTVVVGWMILTSSPTLLAASPAEEGWPRQSRLTAGERTKIYARWFIAMRWIAVLLAAILVFISVRVVGWLPSEVGWPLTLTVAALAGANVLYTVLVRRNRGIPILLPLQAYLDLAILTTLLHFSGGIENPLSMTMLFHVIIGGILLSRRQCYGMAGTASALFALLVLAEWTGVAQHYTLQLYPHFHRDGGEFHPAHHPIYVFSSVLLQAAILFLTAYFVTTLAERMRNNERRLEAMAQQAQAARQLLERALETTGTGLRVLEQDLRLFWASNRWEEWFACQPGEKCSGCDLLNRNDSPAFQSLHDGRIRVTELILDANNCCAMLFQSTGSQRAFQITTAPLLDADGKISQVAELAQDITQQKQTQAQMMRAGKLAAAGELAGQVAHEVNNPIAIVSAKARLLLSDHRNEMSPKVALELGKITDLADRVARIAQGLLSYCRPSAATRVRLDLRVPIRKSLTMVEQHARSKGVRIEDQLPVAPVAVKANANELEQVFLNLFLNALDAMPHGGRLRVSTASGPVQLPEGMPGVAVVVEDTGCGIPEAIREKVFEPFFTTKTEGRGTGLGLSICLGLIRSHGGELELQSQTGNGTRVLVKLPVEAPVETEAKHHG